MKHAKFLLPALLTGAAWSARTPATVEAPTRPTPLAPQLSAADLRQHERWTLPESTYRDHHRPLTEAEAGALAVYAEPAVVGGEEEAAPPKRGDYR